MNFFFSILIFGAISALALPVEYLDNDLMPSSTGRERSESAPPSLNTLNSISEEASFDSIPLTPVSSTHSPFSPTGPIDREIGGHWSISPISSITTSSPSIDHDEFDRQFSLDSSSSISRSDGSNPQPSSLRRARANAGFWRFDSNGDLVPDLEDDSLPGRQQHQEEARPVLLSRDRTLSASPPHLGDVNDATVVYDSLPSRSRPASRQMRIVRPIPVVARETVAAEDASVSLLSRLSRFRFFR